MIEGRGRSAIEVRHGGTAEDSRLSVTLTLSEPLGPGETLLLLRNGSSEATLTSGSVLSRNERLEDGVYTYTARIVDAAGNVSTLDLNGELPGTDFMFRIR